MSMVVRVVRQFYEGAEAVTLSKVLVLPDTLTMGTRLDLRGEGVEEPLAVVGVTLRPVPHEPGLRPPSIDVVLHWEPLAAAELARSGGRRCTVSAP